jgi:hypothetical protein
VDLVSLAQALQRLDMQSEREQQQQQQQREQQDSGSLAQW